jgi:stearoyl-CoA 9-desaturase NADPH oxidoreductase
MSLLTAARRGRPGRGLTGRRLSPLGVVEALATPHGIDRYLELISPRLTVRELRAVVTSVEHTTVDSVTMTLRPTRQWRGFVAGQFVQIAVDIDGVRRIRSYSPSSSQHRADGRFELTVKAHRHGLVSRWLRVNARPGLVLGLSQAAGTFQLPTRRAEHTLLISGGSGITPVLSMLRTLVDEGHRGEVTFLHYAKTLADVAHLAQLRSIGAEHPNVRSLVACTQRGDGDLYGHFEATHLAHAAPWYAQAQTFVCGPPSLMTDVRDLFAAEGVDDALHTEAFTAQAYAPADGDATGSVRFGDTVVENSGATLLEQAEAAGLAPDYGCRMGICFTCVKVKTSGCTRNMRTGELHTEPDAEVQLCISAPVGDVAIDM